AAGVDAVTCSTDKLIGATQGGLILGSEAIVGKCREHPLLRAVRAGKESYAVIAETLRAFATGRQEEEIPIYGMLAAPIDALRALAPGGCGPRPAGRRSGRRRHACSRRLGGRPWRPRGPAHLGRTRTTGPRHAARPDGHRGGSVIVDAWFPSARGGQ